MLHPVQTGIRITQRSLSSDSENFFDNCNSITWVSLGSPVPHLEHESSSYKETGLLQETSRRCDEEGTVEYPSNDLPERYTKISL